MPPPSEARVSLAALNTIRREKFVRALRGIIEQSPHFAVRVAGARPFTSLDELQGAFIAEIERAPKTERLALLRAHPGFIAQVTTPPTATTPGQSSAGPDALAPDEVAEFQRLDAGYRERFGFPFIVSAPRHPKDAILAALRARLENPRDLEFKTALAEVAKIARLRLAELIE